MARKKAVRRWIEGGPRAVWMDRYVQWLVSQPGAELTGSKDEYRARYPTAAERAAKASFFATRPVQEDLIRLLERRPDVREYFEKVRSDVDFHTKELARQEVAENFEIRRAGLRKAAGRKVDEVTGEVTYDPVDVKIIERYTIPYVERGIGKKVEREGQAPRIVINIGSADARALLDKVLSEEEEPVEVEYEIIPNDKLLTDGEDD